MYAHFYAIDIENCLRKLFNCDHFNCHHEKFLSLLSADTIEHNWLMPIGCGLGFLYSRGNDELRNSIDEFLADYRHYLDIGLSELLRFDSRERIIDGTSYSIDFETGEDAVKHLIQALYDICK